MKLALVLAFCLAVASARLPGFDQSNWSDDVESDPTTCQVSSRKVNTFDNVKLPISLPNCYTVLSKDCSSDPKYVVLMRKLSPNSERKQVKIITKTHKIVLTPSEHSDRIEVIVNDQHRQLDQDLELTVRGHPIIRIIKDGQQQVKVECLTTGSKLRFDGNVCDIKVPQVSHNKQCGLCGLTKMELNSKQRSNEFMGMSETHNDQFLTTPDVRHLFAKYVTRDCIYSQPEDECTGYNCPHKRTTTSSFWPESEDECTGYFCPHKRTSSSFRPESEDECTGYNCPHKRAYSQSQDECTGYNCPHKRTPSSFWGESKDETCDEITCPYKQQSSRLFSDDLFEKSPKWSNDETFGEDSDDRYTNKQDYTTSGQQRPLLKHKVVKREDEVCVSLERIPQCPVNTYPERKTEKRIPYKCINRNNQRVRQLESRIRTGEQIPELQRMTPSMTRTEIVPLKCSSTY